MVITGATGAIGRELKARFVADSFDVRKDTWGDEAILVNCMGINYDSVAHRADLKEWQSVIEVNLVQTFDVISLALPGMRERCFGRIINISSMLSKWTVAGTSAYTASKAGLNAMIRVIAKENFKHNVLINNINLGYTEVGMSEGLRVNPMNRIWLDEVTNVIHLLIKTNYITGTCIDINGGLW